MTEDSKFHHGDVSADAAPIVEMLVQACES